MANNKEISYSELRGQVIEAKTRILGSIAANSDGTLDGAYDTLVKDIDPRVIRTAAWDLFAEDEISLTSLSIF